MLRKILIALKNKYVITLILFGFWILFLDEHNLIKLNEENTKLKKQINKLDELKRENINNKKENQQLKNNNHSLEKYAREKFHFQDTSKEHVFFINPNDHK